MKILSASETTELLNRVIESQAARITELEAELKLVNPDVYLAQVTAYAAGYHDGQAGQ